MQLYGHARKRVEKQKIPHFLSVPSLQVFKVAGNVLYYPNGTSNLSHTVYVYEPLKIIRF